MVTLERPINDEEKKLYNCMCELKWTLDEKNYPSLKGYETSKNRRNLECIIKDMISLTNKNLNISKNIDISNLKFYL